jgi:2-dehydro-3-deoxyphosphogluconate aldolase / (4S)-4-hydroxy-2-oxoglutarate aldolase
MSQHSSLSRILDRRLVAIIRSDRADQLVAAARALYEGGIDVLEVTFTVPGALEIIKDVQRDIGKHVLLGAGTVLDTETARLAILAGAEFLVSPTLNLDVIRMGHRYDKLVLPGVFTPTEVLAATEAGAPMVKIFPAEVGGPPYLKALKGPLPQIRLMPTGGVNLETLPQFMAAGASAVGLGSSLVEKGALDKGDFARIRTLAEEYVALMGTMPRKE